MTIVNNFTKYIRYGVKDHTTLTASRCIYDYVMLFGVPEKIYSDCDPTYESELFKQLMVTLGVKKIQTTGYNANANRLCKKSNGIAKQYLLKYVHLLGGACDQNSHEMSYAHNTLIHTSTSFSPEELDLRTETGNPLEYKIRMEKQGRKYVV